MKKYEITDIAHPDNPNLHCIRAVTDLTEDVPAGMLGGYVESRDKTSQHSHFHNYQYISSQKATNAFFRYGTPSL